MLKLLFNYLYLFYIFLQKILNSRYFIFIILGMQLFYYMEFSSGIFCDDGTGGNSNETYGYRSIYKHPNANIENVENQDHGQGSRYNAYDPGLQPTNQGYRAELEARPIAYELDGRPIGGNS